MEKDGCFMNVAGLNCPLMGWKRLEGTRIFQRENSLFCFLQPELGSIPNFSCLSITIHTFGHQQVSLVC